MDQMINSGSYMHSDVQFLLKKVDIAKTDVSKKEALIQSGQAHYSEMISDEAYPDVRYMALFNEARVRANFRIAKEMAELALAIRRDVLSGRIDAQVTVCSLVRAGVPYGVLLHRLLRDLGLSSMHYGVSIIRDRGLDANAMAHILADRPAGGVIFVDGWTGKGAIYTELQKSWKEISGVERPNFLVLADPAGLATYAGSLEDWLIPSGILGANVSGLISRSILSKDVIGPSDFHGTFIVDHLRAVDVSMDYVDRIDEIAIELLKTASPAKSDEWQRQKNAEAAVGCITSIQDAFGIANLNRIKPGIAEATRAVLRRKPYMVLVSDMLDPDLAALVHLCVTNDVKIQERPDMTAPYRAITLIEKVS